MDHTPVAIASVAGPQSVAADLLQELSVLLAAVVVMVVFEMVVVIELVVGPQTNAIERVTHAFLFLKVCCVV